VGGKTRPNTLLAVLMEEAGFSHKGFAARVRAEAARVGHKASPDHVAVSRWLAGGVPHAATIRCITAVLSAKLGRELTNVEVGFVAVEPLPDADSESQVAAESPALADEATHYPAQVDQTAEVMDRLIDGDLADRPFLMSAGWSSVSAPGVITNYLFGQPQQFEIATGPIVSAGTEVAERIRSTIRYFLDLDFQYGGGHVRKMLLFYWKTEIINELRQRYPESVKREVFAAAADAAEVLGWSAYDAGRHGLAQRYFYQGLRLAREANDHLMGGQILANLSHQANYLGNFNEAIQFARAAQSATFGKSTATVDAMFFAMEARALASMGDERGSVEALHRAEQAFDRSDPGRDPSWIKYFDALELAGEAAHCFRDLRKPDEAQRFVVQAIDPVRTPPRTRAFIGMVNAAGALSAGNLDEAVAIATTSLSMDSSLKSQRYLRYLTDFHESLSLGHAGHSSVLQFTELLHSSYPTLRTPLAPKTLASQERAHREASASALDIPQQSRPTHQRSA
jgi:tetratricopeptide (TPR) repeat protein